MEPRLLIYDGHLSHVWYQTLKLAREKNITIIKLPAHTTDLLQPLDISVFKSVKDHWGEELFKRLHTTRSRLSKKEFCSHIASDKVWREAFSETRIKKGFAKCGIYPYNREAYPTYRFDPNLKNRYDVWVQKGKPPLTAEELDEIVDRRSGVNEATPADTSDSNSSVQEENTSTSAETSFCGRPGKIVSYFIHDNEPHNLIRMSSSDAVSPRSSTPNNTGFKELCLKKLDENQVQKTNSAEGNAKRRKINPCGAIVTSDEQFEEAITAAQKKGNGKGEKKKTIEKDKKKEETIKKGESASKKNEDSSSEDIDFTDDEVASIDYESESIVEEDKEFFPPKNDPQGYSYLKCTWEEISPPVKEDNLLNRFFGAIYYADKGRKKPLLYIGKLLRRFLKDENGPTDSLQLDCLKPGLGKTTILEEIPEHFPRDIYDFKVHDIITGPLDGSFVKGGKWELLSYPLVRETFDAVKRLDREKEFDRLYNMQ